MYEQQTSHQFLIHFADGTRSGKDTDRDTTGEFFCFHLPCPPSLIVYLPSNSWHSRHLRSTCTRDELSTKLPTDRTADIINNPSVAPSNARFVIDRKEKSSHPASFRANPNFDTFARIYITITQHCQSHEPNQPHQPELSLAHFAFQALS